METIEIPALCDMHVHFRQGPMAAVAIETAKYCKYALAMPNTKPPLTTGQQCQQYRKAIFEAIADEQRSCEAPTMLVPGFDIMTALYLTEQTSKQDILDAYALGVRAAKAYPRGKTTNSNDGILDYGKLKPALEQMSELGMVLCLHGEHPAPDARSTVLDWETEFVDAVFNSLLFKYQKLKIVLEHITTAAAVDAVRHARANVAATITAHHLAMTLDSILGDGIRPHNYCKPIAKRPYDRDCLVRAAISGSPKFFLGSDSAPHEAKTKEADCGCAGCYTAPVLPGLLATIFEQHHALHRLPNFSSHAASAFYGLPAYEDMIYLRRCEPINPGTTWLRGENSIDGVRCDRIKIWAEVLPAWELIRREDV